MALVEELRDFEFRVSAAGNYQADARSGSHDDLITALGLACLTDGGVSQTPRYSSLPFGEVSSSLPIDIDDWTALHSTKGVFP
jgi:hypothetical protein